MRAQLRSNWDLYVISFLAAMYVAAPIAAMVIYLTMLSGGY
jgi:hypothetical protein